MCGSCVRLLAATLLVLPSFLCSQTGRAQPDTRFAPIPAGEISRPIRPPQDPAVPPQAFGLPQMVKAAGVIFSGSVTAISHRPATSALAVETVSITFRVEQAIRGATPGDNLTILQWIGLWSSGQRYRVGERLLLFLYPTSNLGLTSCVGGPLGRLGFDPWGRVALSAQQISAFRRDPVLGGKSRVSFSDFALAVHQSHEEE
jgi:hypothetical protein